MKQRLSMKYGHWLVLFFGLSVYSPVSIAQPTTPPASVRAKHLEAYLTLLAADLNQREKAFIGLSAEQRLQRVTELTSLTKQPATPASMLRQAQLRGFASVEEDKKWHHDWWQSMRQVQGAWRREDPAFFTLSRPQQEVLYKQAIVQKQAAGTYPVSVRGKATRLSKPATHFAF
jgi:hypothetical protein